jgi:hypothetical protein
MNNPLIFIDIQYDTGVGTRVAADNVVSGKFLVAKRVSSTEIHQQFPVAIKKIVITFIAFQ